VRSFTLALLCGCLGEATVTYSDLSASVFDLAQPRDQGGDGGARYNCTQLNDCERACAGDPKPANCIADCRAMASASAVQKEMALQSCFGVACPQSTDAGTGAICTPTDMGFTQACRDCIQNSQVAAANTCVGNPPECHQCYDQAAACVADQ
jgi:hypothetical protein